MKPILIEDYHNAYKATYDTRNAGAVDILNFLRDDLGLPVTGRKTLFEKKTHWHTLEEYNSVPIITYFKDAKGSNLAAWFHCGMDHLCIFDPPQVDPNGLIGQDSIYIPIDNQAVVC